MLGLAYVIAAPPSSDLAAAAYRSELFSRVGFTLWDNSWYGGHHLPAYSLLAPALGALIGPQLLAALSMTAATALFAALIDGRFPARATRVAGLLFAIGASISLLSNRVPFDLGLAIALGSLLAAQRERARAGARAGAAERARQPRRGRLPRARLSRLGDRGARARPAGGAGARRARPDRRAQLVFPEGGAQPFAASAFYPELAGALLIAALVAARAARAAHRRAAVRARADRRLRAADRRGRQRRPARRAVRGAAAGLPAAGRIGDRPPAAPAARARCPCCSTGRPTRRSPTSPPARRTRPSTPPTTRRCSASCGTLGVGYGARPARIEVLPSVRSRGGALGGSPRDDRARLGAPARHPAQRALLRHRRRSPRRATAPGCPLRRSPTSRCPMRRWTTPAKPRRGCCAARRGPPTCAKCGARRTGACSPWPAPRRSSPRPRSLTQLGTDSFTLRAPRAGHATWCACTSPPTGRSPAAAAAWRARRATGRRCRRARPASVHVVISFSLARVFSRGPRCS